MSDSQFPEHLRGLEDEAVEKVLGEDPLLTWACQMAAEEIRKDWATTKPEERDRREELYAEYRVSRRVFARLHSLASCAMDGAAERAKVLHGRSRHVPDEPEPELPSRGLSYREVSTGRR